MNPSHPRIASLLPSATEIVAAVGAADQLVGISHECDHPDGVRDRPVLTSARIDSSAPSGAIDASVREVVESALSVYAIDAELLAELAPDVIVTQALCEVCAVSLSDVRAAVARLANRDEVEVVSLEPARLDDVFDDVTRVAAAVGRSAEGGEVRAALAARVERVAARAREAPRRPRVATIEWLDPVMIGGLWMPDLIELAGGVPVGVEAGRNAVTVTPGELASLRPDVVVVKPCGLSLARTRRERDLVARNVAAAVPDARVYLTDGNAYFNRPGPRLVESAEILAACIHPKGFRHLRELHRSAIEPWSPTPTDTQREDT